MDIVDKFSRTSDNTLQKINIQILRASFATETLGEIALNGKTKESAGSGLES